MTFYSDDVKTITGVARIRLHNWMKEGFITPSSEKVAQGHGTKNEYTREDLYKIALLKKLIESGIHGFAASSLLGYDFSLLHRIHKEISTRNNPNHVLTICVLMRFSDDDPKVTTKNPRVETIDNLSDLFPKKGNKSLTEKMSELFINHKYDQAIIVNLSKIFDDIDSRI